MDQEGGASSTSLFSSRISFVRGIPAGDHDVVQLVAQKGIYNGFVFTRRLRGIGERAHRGQAATQELGLSSLRTVSVE